MSSFACTAHGAMKTLLLLQVKSKQSNFSVSRLSPQALLPFLQPPDWAKKRAGFGPEDASQDQQTGWGSCLRAEPAPSPTLLCWEIPGMCISSLPSPAATV